MIFFALVCLVLLIYVVLDILRTPSACVRTLPKALWLFVVLPPLLGPAAWFLAGRPGRNPSAPTREVAPPVPPDDDPEFLRELRRRADDQRRRAQDPRDDAA